MASATFSEPIAAAPDATAPMLDLTIACREEQAQGVIVLDLVDPVGRRLPPFEAGAHVDVEISPGLIRQYSLCQCI